VLCRAKYVVDDSISIVKESFDNDLTPYYALAISIWGLSCLITLFLRVIVTYYFVIYKQSSCLLAQWPEFYSCL